MHKILRLINLFLAAVLLSTVPASAQLAQPPITVTPCVERCACHDGSITVLPINPTPSDEIQIIVSAPWSSSCPAVTCFKSIDDHRISLDFTVVDMSTIVPVICLTVISTWTMTNTVGTLPPGSYTVEATIRAGPCWSCQLLTTFDVSQPTVPQITYWQYLPLVLAPAQE
ncbi:MAG: hypothetical protein H5T63_00505 [Chloroflexi bacterium]|nr:hypothetical protein [Chloroflexota bacterium]